MSAGGLSRDIVNFESTCRALSADLVSARAAAEKTRHQRMIAAERSMSRQSLEDEKGDGIGTNTTCDEDKGPTGNTENKDGDKEMKEDKQSSQPEDKKKKSARSHRSSKRVLSQRITSGKNAERSAKRKSVEYCLVSAAFSCTTQHPVYAACLKNEGCWKTSSNDGTGSQEDDALATTTPTPASPVKMSRAGRLVGGFDEGSDSSLKSFVLAWSGRNSGASDVLSGFLSHVSQHIVEVFSSEVGDTVALSSCILECKLCNLYLL